MYKGDKRHQPLQRSVLEGDTAEILESVLHTTDTNKIDLSFLPITNTFKTQKD